MALRNWGPATNDPPLDLIAWPPSLFRFGVQGSSPSLCQLPTNRRLKIKKCLSLGKNSNVFHITQLTPIQWRSRLQPETTNT